MRAPFNQPAFRMTATQPTYDELAQALRDIVAANSGHSLSATLVAANHLVERLPAPGAMTPWINVADSLPQESDGEVFVRFTDGSIGTGWATYWHGASNAFAQWTFPDPDEERKVARWMRPDPL